MPLAEYVGNWLSPQPLSLRAIDALYLFDSSLAGVAETWRAVYNAYEMHAAATRAARGTVAVGRMQPQRGARPSSRACLFF